MGGSGDTFFCNLLFSLVYFFQKNLVKQTNQNRVVQDLMAKSFEKEFPSDCKAVAAESNKVCAYCSWKPNRLGLK